MEYRREIDGMRAVAVMPVILFHAGLNLFQGGYVGVDIFFVISGYLITTIILNDLTKDNFSIVAFYDRRARRILPALFFITLACFPFAWMWLSPHYLEEFSQSVMAVASFCSNFLFYSQSGYFDTAAELKPLLHTWSLAVEEQFYLFFPVFLFLLWKFARKILFGALLVVGVCSLFLAQWMAHHNPSAAFYLLPTRGWELAVGALLAYYFVFKKDQKSFAESVKKLSGALAFVGLVLIGYAVFAYDRTTPFPGFHALAPTVGAALVIAFATPSNTVGRLLGAKPLVGLGLISYSAYLWHYPLFVFARHRLLTEPSLNVFLGLAAASLILAYLSWKFIETPFRNKAKVQRKTIFTFAGIGSVFLITAGFLGYFGYGWPTRMPEGLISALSSAVNKGPLVDKWHIMGPGQPDDVRDSFKNVAPGKNDDNIMYLIGDSHAGAIAEGLMQTLDNSDYGFMYISYTACPPIENVYRPDKGDDHRCYEHNQDLYNYILENDQIKYVVLAARWTLYLEKERFDNGEGGVEYGEPGGLDVISDNRKIVSREEDRKSNLEAAYQESIQKLLDAGKKVVIVYPIPEVGWSAPAYINKWAFIHGAEAADLDKSVGSTDYQAFLERNKGACEMLDSLGQHPNLYRVYPERIFCDTFVKGRCAVQSNGRIFYRDDNHLSIFGARLVAREILKTLQ
ncbi:acyltransferase 3 [Desulfatibacillum aliphaticivorans]|uniref:Acyltransferase 3 n=1 Tax=Desulfatibacillum aliphaticivorans TaxID=218208 RepID=B8FEL1_DESAL|nr:acyltransferase family protein [Desulfatibacillum aliphaticivorans]ACL03415.1 acyltransferase 3 [Desulfatibacillum aliphaticivorans]